MKAPPTVLFSFFFLRPTAAQSSLPSFPTASACLRLHLCGSLSVSVVVGFATSTYSQPPTSPPNQSPDHSREPPISDSLSLCLVYPGDSRPFLPLVERSIDSSASDCVHCEPSLHFRRVREVTLEFRSVTTSVVGANSSLFGWICLDVELNKDCSYSSGAMLLTGIVMSMDYENLNVILICASFGITRLICAFFEITRLLRASFGITRLIYASFGINRLICASFGITRLICASFGITRLICVSFGITRLMCAFYETTRLLCNGMARGRPARGKNNA
ncbi:mucin-19-like isoform X6 [Cucumis melo var. makuwa]|uniref:Mucin-19-like isoform X6 n=1 Tax=Cucumis melo var. makuwa TaxID=1194695 RepID=A0A5D3CY38_CUCMM|nr:mucin-19-like isoform X6 [Cucumis melo var. makuwa]TYK16833.1 mucin-19-like isoform X6 [Cucumis melo var. makuwa]